MEVEPTQAGPPTVGWLYPAEHPPELGWATGNLIGFPGELDAAATRWTGWLARGRRISVGAREALVWPSCVWFSQLQFGFSSYAHLIFALSPAPSLHPSIHPSIHPTPSWLHLRPNLHIECG